MPNRSAYRGCLLGLAVGDAMGHTVDEKSWQDIQEDIRNRPVVCPGKFFGAEESSRKMRFGSTEIGCNPDQGIPFFCG